MLLIGWKISLFNMQMYFIWSISSVKEMALEIAQQQFANSPNAFSLSWWTISILISFWNNLLATFVNLRYAWNFIRINCSKKHFVPINKWTTKNCAISYILSQYLEWFVVQLENLDCGLKLQLPYNECIHSWSIVATNNEIPNQQWWWSLHSIWKFLLSGMV